MSDIFSLDAMKKRFHEALAERAVIHDLLAPVRAEYDKVRNEIMALEREKLGPLIAKLKEIEAPLFHLQNELARLARALGGKTGEPPTAEGESPPNA